MAKFAAADESAQKLKQQKRANPHRQAAAVERAGSVSAGALAGRGERTEVSGGGGAR